MGYESREGDVIPTGYESERVAGRQTAVIEAPSTERGAEACACQQLKKSPPSDSRGGQPIKERLDRFRLGIDHGGPSERTLSRRTSNIDPNEIGEVRETAGGIEPLAVRVVLVGGRTRDGEVLSRS